MMRSKLMLGGALLGCVLTTIPALAGTVTVQDGGDADAAFASRRVALLIGVDEYVDDDLTRLAFAAKDARDVASALKDPVTGDYDEVHVLTGPEATRREAILAKLRAVTAGLQRDDTFLLYLSGHGTLTLDPIDGTRLWFLPSDAQLDQPEDKGLDVGWLEQTLSELVPRRRVLIMDTCHNGRADGSRAALNASTRDRLTILRGEPPAPNPVAEVTESEARLYAAQYYQPAMEDKSLQNGVYTHYLLSALGSDRDAADLDGNGLVDVTEAHDYAQERTIRHTGGLQVPRAEYRIVGREAIYLAGDPGQRTRAERALISGYDNLLASARLFVDGQSRGSLPSVVAIEPGRHTLEIQTTDGRTIYADKVRVQAGDHLQIEDLRPVRSQVSVFAGAVVSHSNDALPGLAPDVELVVRPAMKGDWRLGVHARVSGTANTRDYERLSESWGLQGAEFQAIGAMPSAGLSVAYEVSDRLLVGPQLEAGAYYRRVTCRVGEMNCSLNGALDGERVRNEVTATVLPGLRTEFRVFEAAATAVSLRYDVRVAPLWARSGDTLSVQPGVLHGVSLGGSF